MLLLDLFLGLVAEPGARARADRAANHRARRACDRAADQGARDGAAGTAGTRAGLVVAVGRLTGDRAAGGTDHAADGRADRPADHHAHAGTRQGPGTGAHGLGRVLLVLGRRALIRQPLIGRAERVVVMAHVKSPAQAGSVHARRACLPDSRNVRERSIQPRFVRGPARNGRAPHAGHDDARRMRGGRFKQRSWWAGAESNRHSRRRGFYRPLGSPPARPTHEMVEMRGLEPLASAMRTRRSPS